MVNQKTAITLLLRSEGLRVALVEAQNRIHLQPLTTGRDGGSTVEITEGIDDQSRLVRSPSDSLYEGEQVNVARDEKHPGSAQKIRRHGPRRFFQSHD